MTHQFRVREDGRPIHLAGCPCWRTDPAPSEAVIGGRWTSVTPGDARVPRTSPVWHRPRPWRLWGGV